MLFSEPVFLFAFLPIVLVVYFVLLRGMRKAQNLFLLLASLFFYGWGEPRFVLVMMLSIAMNYGFGLWIHRCRVQDDCMKLPIAVAMSCNLVILFIFKYLTFTLTSLNQLGFGWTVPVIELPIGISFFTFQAISYVLDVAMCKTEVQRSPLALGLYISVFPQLIAGPIVKYTTVAHEIEGRVENWADFSYGCTRFLTGLGKKVLLANQMAIIADRVFATDPADLSTPMAWLGSLCYTFQIYYDFSGYSDMAIGLGRIFGFHFLENFNYPYAAKSITEFWRRWHISLSTWFRDYLYIPLGGNRNGKRNHLRNLFVVWLLTGLWHGANWTFVIWGLLYFFFASLETFTHFNAKWFVAFQRLYTLLITNLLWMLFRSDTLKYAARFFLTMLGFQGTGMVDATAGLYFRENIVFLILALVFSFPFAPWLRKKLEQAHIGSVDISALCDVLYALGLVAIGVICTCYLVKGAYNPFIYFRF